MSPPWVQYDRMEPGGNCDTGSEPDIAGVGVVLSFILAAFMATTASILAMVLDQAFDAKGHFSPRDPLKYLREQFLNTEWKREYAWRPFLDPLIIGLGDQQLVTGYAVLLSGWIKVVQNAFEVQGAHFVLILYVCALSSSSHLAALITLRKYFRKYKLIANIRMTLVIIFAIFLLGSMIAAMCIPSVTKENNGERDDRLQGLSFLVPMLFIVLGFSTALVCILYRPPQEGVHIISRNSDLSERKFNLPRRDSDYYVWRLCIRLVANLFLNPLIAFTVQILLAILSAVLVLSQKFATPDDSGKWCGLQDGGDNAWGFGQTLSVVMLLLPVFSAGQVYLEGRQVIREGR